MILTTTINRQSRPLVGERRNADAVCGEGIKNLEACKKMKKKKIKY